MLRVGMRGPVDLQDLTTLSSCDSGASQ
uniref:Uncharacterized protein n=1 Tax=Arundo donax TaxID=35708 RepID=A0A0A9H9E2_ARUDO